MRYDLNILQDYIDRKLVVKQDHPTLPLSIYNYSRSCQYEKAWDDITLNMRGTILDHEGNVVAKAFPKFFNYEEVADKVPVQGDYVYVQEKVDGSLGILFYYNNEWHLATKGSFTSEQAIRGMEIIKSKYNLSAFITEMVYICEIIYPENRIVVNYGDESKVVFLSVVSHGEEQHWTTAKTIFNASGIDDSDIVKTDQYFTFGTGMYDALKDRNEDNKEGFILRFQPGNFRMKIKFEEYVRLHKIVTNFSSTDIWEIMMTKQDIAQFLERVPDEFDNWVQLTMLSLRSQFDAIKMRCILDYSYYSDIAKGDKKAFALLIKDERYKSILFSMFDNKQYDQAIWKLIKPKYSKPFKQDEDQV